METADHKYTDSELIGTRGWWFRFLKLHPVTSPPTSQKSVHELIRHPETHTPNVAFKNTSLNAIREFWSFEQELSFVFAWCLAISTLLSFTTTSVSRLSLLHEGHVDPRLPVTSGHLCVWTPICWHTHLPESLSREACLIGRPSLEKSLHTPLLTILEAELCGLPFIWGCGQLSYSHTSGRSRFSVFALVCSMWPHGQEMVLKYPLDLRFVLHFMNHYRSDLRFCFTGFLMPLTEAGHWQTVLVDKSAEICHYQNSKPCLMLVSVG